MKNRLKKYLLLVFIFIMACSVHSIAFAQDSEISDTIDISFAKVKCEEKVLYDGSKKCPDVEVSLNEIVLVSGVDFVVHYENNKNPGEAAVIIEGIGRYYGTVEVSFEIVKRLDKPVLTISNDEATGKPKITWKKVINADKYEVYRAASGKDTYVLIGTTSSLSYTDKTAKASELCYYKVKAVDADFNQASSKLSGFGYSRCDLARPSLSVGNDADSGKPKASWSKVSGADKYYVYRATSKNGTYTKIKTTTETSYTDKDAKKSKSYYYKVRAIDSDISSANSAYSKIVNRVCDLPRTTAKATVVSSTGKPRITWDSVIGADKYYVYRATSKNGTYTRILTTTGTVMTNISAKAGERYYYKIVAVDADVPSANSAFSKVVSRTCDIAKPQVKIVDNLQTGKPKLKWTKLEGADKYEIYRSTSKNGTYSKTYTTSKTTYINTAAKTGYTYYYKIKAINIDNSEANSTYSNVVSTYVIDPNKKMVALTFDDGPGPYTEDIIDCLKKNRAHATFFVLGERIGYYPGVIEKAYKNGNEIGNHSYSHPILTSLSSSNIKSQMSRTDSKIKEEIGVKAALMRPPGGGVNSTVRNNVGKPIIYWSIDTEDWKTGSKTATVNAVMNNVRDGDIVLMHDIHSPTRDAALELIPKLKNKGYQIVTVSEMAKYKGYKLENGTVYYYFR